MGLIGHDVPVPAVREEITDGRITTGIMLALLGHALTLVPAVVYAVRYSMRTWWIAWYVGLYGQALVLLLCLAIGVVWLVRGDDGLGRGLIIGWVMGLIVAPVMFVALVWLGYLYHACCP
jgi:hypothetical protein